MTDAPETAETKRPRVALHVKILLGLVLGTAGGLAANLLWPASAGLEWAVANVAAPIGQIFLRFLLMVVVPLVFTTLVLGITGLGDLRRLGKMGARTGILFVCTTVLASLIGLTLANVFRPGEVISAELRADLIATFAPQASATVAAAGSDLTIDTLVNIVPRNPLEAAVNGDLIAFIFFAIVFGIALARVRPSLSKPVTDVLEGVGQAVMTIIGFAMRLAPLGIAALAFAVTARLGLEVLAPVGLYFTLVMAGLAFHQFGVLALLVKTLGGMSPARFYKAIRLPMITAFSTASSSATLPTTIRAAEKELGISEEVAGFVLPLGATLHMNGTALFGALTIVFLAQAFDVHLSLGTQLMIVGFMVLTAVSAAGIPSGAIPLIVVILESVGIPGEAIALVFGVEAITGMARTSTNVTGDLFAAVYLQRAERRDKP